MLSIADYCYDQKLIKSLKILPIWIITSISSLKNSLRSRQMLELLYLPVPEIILPTNTLGR
jgi:hypothetical protein